MKNLLIYLHPAHSFPDEAAKLVRIQIDNSLDLGWNRKDILLITNFPYQYNGVKALKISDEHLCLVRPLSTNTTTLPYLIKQGFIDKGKVYWVHDFDAYENFLINEKKLELENFDLGLTDYGWQPRWCMGSYFIKNTSYDILKKARPLIYTNLEDETVMVELTKDPSTNSRCKRLNITYNFGMRNVESNWQKADKPIKVVHFHPFSRRLPTLDIFMHGKNGLNIPLVSERLIKIFNYHGIS